MALQDIYESISEINEIYRDTLKALFSGQDPITDAATLLEEEKNTLSAVCERIENIYSRLIKRHCMVTVKLLIEENQRSYAIMLTRSEKKSSRERGPRNRYEVGTGANIAFDKATMKRNGKKSSHYHSSDLSKEGNEYSNQRQNYMEFYRNVLVVPIRATNVGEEGTDHEFDNIGFLCIDTNSTNRINDGYHLHMLTSLSNQMYNFMSLMRGKYTVLVD